MRYSFGSKDNCSSNDEEYAQSDEDIEDKVLSTSFAGDDHGSVSDESDEAIAKATSLYEGHKKSFYATYTPVFESVKTSTHLITDEKYAHILAMLQAELSKKDSMATRKIRNVYQLSGNVECHCVFHDGKKVTTFKSVFDVILAAHRKIGHARDKKKNKDTLNNDLQYYGVPRSAVKIFVDSCLIVSMLLFCYALLNF
jgi:hypothetical protein